MKQKAPANKNQKYLAILLAVIMFSSVFLMLFSGGSDSDQKASSGNGNEASTPSAETNISTIPFSQIPSKQVHHQFNSIADGLNMSPDGVISAAYVDLQKTTGTPLEQSFGNKTMMKPFYGADVTKRYSAYYSDGNGFELHSIPEQKILKSFVPIPYKGYQLLARDTSANGDVWNVVGSPVILGSRQSVKSVIDVLEGNATSATGYNQVLSQADPKNVIFQVVVARTDNTTDVPADQYYNDFRKLDDGSFEQTSLFLNIKPDLAKNITALQATSSERGVTYNLTTSGKITKLVLISDFNRLSNETKLLM
jgi:hypothetical protein